MNEDRVERCEQCRFWQHREKMQEGEGMCRRYPPQRMLYELIESKHLVFPEGEEPILKKSWDARMVNWFPITPADEWCGEFQSQEKKPGILDAPLSALNFSIRVTNILSEPLRIWPPDAPEAKYVHLQTVGDLVALSARDLQEQRNFGKTCLQEVRLKLEEHGLKLKGDW